MEEELIENKPADSNWQKDIIYRHCKGFEEELRTASSKSAASRLVDKWCDKFDNECPSAMVRNFLKRYAHDLFDLHWMEKV